MGIETKLRIADAADAASLSITIAVALLTFTPPVYAQSAAYRDGLKDRTVYENWVNTLDSETLIGANYWAAQRSLAHPAACGQTSGSRDAGCRAAQLYLTPTDARRSREPDYRLGWNAYQQTSASNVQPTPAPTETPTMQSTVKFCVNVVHHTKASMLGSWNENFDAFIIAKPDGSASVQNNAGHVGDQDGCLPSINVWLSTALHCPTTKFAERQIALRCGFGMSRKKGLP
jgi:hypothetical protein